MTPWQQVKPGNTVTVSKTFTVDTVHTSEVTGRVMLTDQDFTAYTEHGWDLVIVRDDPWHAVTDGFGTCGCDIGRNHTEAEYRERIRP